MTTATGTCWADPLSRAERRVLREKLAHACKRFWGGQYAFIGKDDQRRSYRDASAEMSDLHLDVTERGEMLGRYAEALEAAGYSAHQSGDGSYLIVTAKTEV